MPLLFTSLFSGGAGGGGGDSGFSTASLVMDAVDLSTLLVAVGAGGDWDDGGIREIGNIIHDPGDTGKEYKLTYSGFSGAYAGNNVFVGGAYSTDGSTWTKYSSVSPLIARSLEDPYVIKVGSTYYLYAEDKADSPFRNIRCYTSTDFTTWTDQGDVLDIGTGWEATDVSSPTVWKEGTTWHMLYEGRGSSQGGAVGHATSSDGLTWTKDSVNNPVFVGTNATYGYAGVAWALAVVPDDLVISSDGDYVLFFHGQHEDTSNFVPGIASGASLTTLADALDQPLITPFGQNIGGGGGTPTLHPLFDPPRLVDNRVDEGVFLSEKVATPVTILDVTFAGPNGSTSFSDATNFDHPLTAFGNAQIQSNLLELDGSGDYVSDGERWTRLPYKKLIIEAFDVVFDSLSGGHPVASVYESTGNFRSWDFRYAGGLGGLSIFLSADGTTTTQVTTSGGISAGTPYDLKATWDADTGDVEIYIDDVLSASGNFAGPLFSAHDINLIIGGSAVTGASPTYMDGRMSRFKLTIA